MAAGSYRGQTSASPVSPYAFTSTPALQTGPNPLRQHPTTASHPRLETRAASVPSLPTFQQTVNAVTSSRTRPPAGNTTSAPLNSSNPSTQVSASSNALKDLSSVNLVSSRPLSAIDLNAPSPSYASVAKASPDRYKRNHQRSQTSNGLPSNTQSQGGSAVPSGSGMATVGHLYNHPAQSTSTPTLSPYASYRGTTASQYSARDTDLMHQPRLASKDDMNLHRQSSELAKRYRRRSISSLEAKEFGLPASETAPAASQPKTYAAMLATPSPHDRKESRSTTNVERPSSSHGRNTSAESSVSSRSASASASVSCQNSKPYECFHQLFSTSLHRIFS